MTESRWPLQPGTLEILAATPGALRALLGGLPRAVATRQVEGDWSPRDVAAHLLSVERWAFADRIRLILEEDNAAVPGVDEEMVLERSGYRARTVPWLLEAFERRRLASLAIVRSAPPEHLSRGGQHAELGRITAANVTHHIAFHDLTHLRQIVTMLEGPLQAGRGNMHRAF